MIHDPKDASLFPRLPEQEVRNLARYGSEVRLEDRDLLFSEDDPPRDFFVVLEGEVEVAKHMPEGEETVLAVHGRGEFTGDVSLVTGSRVTASARAVGPSRVCRIAAEDFRRAMVENPTVAEVVFRAVATRTQELGAQMQQTAKLASLGAMAAGLAHELNNPAAAAIRAADRLGESLRELRGLALTSSENYLTAEQRELLSSALAGASGGFTSLDGPGDPLTRSDREDELADWLEERGLEDVWDLAPAFVEAGLDEEGLEGIVGRMNRDAAAGTLSWLGATLAAEGSAEEVKRAAAQISELMGAMEGYTYMDQATLQEVDVHQGLENTLVILGHKLKRGVEVQRDYDLRLPRVWARGSELNQVWTTS